MLSSRLAQSLSQPPGVWGKIFTIGNCFYLLHAVAPDRRVACNVPSDIDTIRYRTKRRQMEDGTAGSTSLKAATPRHCFGAIRTLEMLRSSPNSTSLSLSPPVIVINDTKDQSTSRIGIHNPYQTSGHGIFALYVYLYRTVYRTNYLLSI